MADIHLPDEAETRARWGAFAWTPANAAEAAKLIARSPAGRQRSAVMPTAFSHLQAMEFMSKGPMLADTTAIIGAIDVVFGECDR